MVRMFMLEKGITLPMEDTDTIGAGNRRPPYTDKNPAGTVPALELDDGRVIAETVAVCEYLDEINPGRTLVGVTAEERALSRMWQRRVELRVTEFMYDAFRFGEGLGFFKDRIHTFPEASAGLKERARQGLSWLDGLIVGRPFICGAEIRIADLVLFCCMDFANGGGQPLNPNLKNVDAWFKRVDSRPSAKASLHPGWEPTGVKG
jgi:glutathione S-transferase